MRKSWRTLVMLLVLALEIGLTLGRPHLLSALKRSDSHDDSTIDGIIACLTEYGIKPEQIVIINEAHLQGKPNPLKEFNWRNIPRERPRLRKHSGVIILPNSTEVPLHVDPSN